MQQQSDKYQYGVVIDSDAIKGQQIQAAIIAKVEEFNYSEHDAFAVRLAVEEALINAIKHGNGSDPSKKVRIDYEITAEQVRVRVEDDGPGFDLDNVPDPTSPEFLERPCGRGLMLIRHYMSEVNFNERGNCVEMLKRKDEPRDEDD